MKQKQNITIGSLFDGIGGFPYAGSFYGIEPVWASEILPQAVSVTMRHFPGMRHVGDITKLDGAKLPPVDVITFGSPCQDLSTAGKRAGLSGERSGLFMEAIRIIDEMRKSTNGKYPRYALWENVPGAMSSGKPAGSDFRAVLEAFTKAEIPMPESGRWAYAGMVRGNGVDLAWRILDAQHFGVPQRRRRVFLVCDFGGASAGEILFIEEGLRGHFAQGRQAGQRTAAHAQGSVGNANTGGLTAFAANQRDEVRDLHNVSAAVCAQPGMKQQTFIAENCLNPWDAQQTRVFTEDGTSPTLAGADGGGGRNPGGLVFAAFLGEVSAKARSIGYSENVSPTLKAGASGSATPCLCEPELARTLTARGDSSPCIDRGQNMVALKNPAITMRMREGCDGGGKGPLLQEEKSAALATRGDQYLFAPAVSVHQSGIGELSISNTAKSLTTISTASCRNAPLVCSNIHAFSLDSVESNSMKSSNPYSGCRKVETARTVDTTNPSPSKNQGGIAIVVHPDISGTLCASGAGLSRPAGMASEPDLCVAYAQEPIPIHDKATRHKNGGAGNGLGVGKAGGSAPTLTSGDKHGVMIASGKASIGTLMANAGTKMWLGNQEAFSGDYFPIQNYTVRRLTPTECERLQGFPDGWTRFGHDGKEISDTRRYQMLGNSVAVPCVAYIMSGIAAQIYFCEKEAA